MIQNNVANLKRPSEYTCPSKADLKKHKKQHTGEKKEASKRGLSISPEANVSNKKAALRNKSTDK